MTLQRQLDQPVANLRNSHFIQTAGGFFTVTGNKRNSRILSQQGGQFVVGTPSAFAKEWLEKRLRSLVTKVLISITGEEIEVPADLVVLMVGMEPREDAARVARLVNISQDKDGWFIESHPKLDPVATTTARAPTSVPSRSTTPR